MEQDRKIQNALKFVDLLVPNGFEEARMWLSDSCTYTYQDTVLTGSKIIDSFVGNHKKALEKLASVEYIDGKFKEISDEMICINVQDRISVNGKHHLYTDCMAVVVNDKDGYGSIDKVANFPYPEEREKLAAFFKEAGVTW